MYTVSGFTELHQVYLCLYLLENYLGHIFNASPVNTYVHCWTVVFCHFNNPVLTFSVIHGQVLTIIYFIMPLADIVSWMMWFTPFFDKY